MEMNRVIRPISDTVYEDVQFIKKEIEKKRTEGSPYPNRIIVHPCRLEGINKIFGIEITRLCTNHLVECDLVWDEQRFSKVQVIQFPNLSQKEKPQPKQIPVDFSVFKNMKLEM